MTEILYTKPGASPQIRVAVTTKGEFRYSLGNGSTREIRDTYRALVKQWNRWDFPTKCYLGDLADFPALVNELPLGFQVSAEADVLEALRARSKDLTDRAQLLDASLRSSKLFPYQREGVAYLTTRKACGLFDEMGLGKTVQAIMAIPTLADGKCAPTVIVCPTSVKGVWRSELKKWRPAIRQIFMLAGRHNMVPPEAGEVVILNYEILPDKEDLDLFQEEQAWTPGTVLIADEVHATKTGRAKRTKLFRQLREIILDRGGRSYGLTGTPLLNQGRELGEVCKSIGIFSDAFESEKDFESCFHGEQDYYTGRWKTDFRNPKPELAQRLATISLRRHRKDVLTDLPNKTHGTPIEADPPTGIAAAICDEALADSLITDALKSLHDNTEDQMAGMGALSAARKALASCKIPKLLEVVEEYEENGHPLIVFSAHRGPIDVLAKRSGWITITGSTNPVKRSQIEKDFQAGKYKGIAGTIRAMSEGITLTHSHNVLFVDLDWTPARNAQAEDRACRIGQQNGVLVQHLVADHELDEMIHELLVAKQIAFDKSVNQIPAFQTEKVELASSASPMMVEAEELARLADLLQEALAA